MSDSDQVLGDSSLACRTKMARKMLLRGTNFLTKIASKASPNLLSLYFVGLKHSLRAAGAKLWAFFSQKILREKDFGSRVGC